MLQREVSVGVPSCALLLCATTPPLRCLGPGTPARREFTHLQREARKWSVKQIEANKEPKPGAISNFPQIPESQASTKEG